MQSGRDFFTMMTAERKIFDKKKKAKDKSRKEKRLARLRHEYTSCKKSLDKLVEPEEEENKGDRQ